MTILIAEDEKVLADVLKDEFEVAGYKVIIAKDGQETMNILKSKSDKIDLLLLDLLMPVMDGFQVLEEMANVKITVPVIVLSNLGQDKEIKKALEMGVTDYFVKTQHPIAEVIEKVKKALEKGSAIMA